MKFIILLVFLISILLLRQYIIQHIFTPKRKQKKQLPAATFKAFTTKGQNSSIHGWIMKKDEHSAKTKCFILVHGWGSDKTSMLRYTQPLLEANYHVILFDVPGHGESESPPGQVSIKTFVESIDSIIASAKTNDDIDSNEIYVLGHSMGGGAASIVNATDTSLKGLITDSIPTSLKNISSAMTNGVSIPYIPFGWLFLNWFLFRGNVLVKVRSEWKLENIFMQQKAPALAIHSEYDSKVPIQNIFQLENHSNFRQTLRVSTQGHHNSVKDERFWDSVFCFLKEIEEC